MQAEGDELVAGEAADAGAAGGDAGGDSVCRNTTCSPSSRSSYVAHDERRDLRTIGERPLTRDVDADEAPAARASSC